MKEKIKKEFPNDPAQQQVHIARKILAQEAEQKGMSLIDYIKSEAKSLRARSTTVNKPTNIH